MRRIRRRRAAYAAPHNRYPRPNGEQGFFRRILGALKTAGAFLLSIAVFPLAALASLLGKKRGRRMPVAASGDGAADFPLPFAAPVYKGGTRPLIAKLLRAVDMALLGVLAAASLFFGWALLYSDTSIPVTLCVNGQTRAILTKAESVDELFARNSVALREDDALNYETTSALLPNMELTVDSAFPVAVASGGEVTILRLHGGSVGKALSLAGVSYDADDEITALPFADVEPGMHIRHIDVEKEYETVNEVIEYREETIKDNTVYIGNDTVQTEGVNGERLTVRQIIYRDGVLSSREIMNQIILKEAVDEVKIVGTKIRYQTSLTGDTRVWKPKPTGDQIKETMVVSEITAYTHTGSRTATGRRPKVGYIAVNPSVIPYGTKLYIPGYGYCTAQDTGAFRHEEGGAKNQIDLFMETEKECVKWGRKRNVTVYILK